MDFQVLKFKQILSLKKESNKRDSYFFSLLPVMFPS